MKKRCVIIGGTGFLGMNTAKALLNAGCSVVIIDKKMSKKYLFPEIFEFIDLHIFDYKNKDKLGSVLRKDDILFHFASSTLPGSSPDQIEKGISNDIVGSIGLFRAAVKKDVSKIIFASSGGTVYGDVKINPIIENTLNNPKCFYGVSKLLVEKYLKLFHVLYGIDYVIYRISNAYGPGQNPDSNQGLIANVIGKMLKNKPINIYGEGQTIRDYIFIDDIANAFLRAANNNVIKNDVFNIGTGIGYSVAEVVEKISKTLKVKPQIIREENRKCDVKINILDSNKFKMISGWEPKIDIEQGIEMTHKWIKTI